MNKNAKKLVASSLVIIALVFGFLFYSTTQANISKSSHIANNDNALSVRFAELSTNGNSFCFGPDAVLRMSDSDYLTGSCCGPMNLHRYQEQLEGLKKYSNINKIPSDPYNISVSLAKELINYASSIKLNAEQQKIYNDAMEMSEEGGPCCCQCWRWYVYEGLAKYLITEYNFNTAQIVEIWNLSDGCGGEEHEHMAGLNT